MNPLDQLHDIILAPEVGVWPPAPGWWVLALIIIVGLVASVRYAMKAYRQRTWKRQALAELDSLAKHHSQHALDDALRAKLLSDLSALIKRVMVSSGAHDSNIRSLHTTNWRQALLNAMPNADSEMIHALADARYGANPPAIDPEWFRAIRQWIRSLKV